MKKVINDAVLRNKQKVELIDELRKNNPLASDRRAPQVAIWMLGLVVMTTEICMTVLGKEHNEGLIALGSAAVGGLAGLISQTPRSNDDNRLKPRLLELS